MTKDLTGAYAEWCFARNNTIEFIKGMDEMNLVTPLKRPELDTFKKHVLEMIDVQEAYSNAIVTGKMSFATLKGNDEFTEEVSTEELLKRLELTDKKMKERLENAAFDFQIECDGENKTLSSHLCALVSHEMFHIGQWIGFCYAQDIKIPSYLVDMWGLSVQNKE